MHSKRKTFSSNRMIHRCLMFIFGLAFVFTIACIVYLMIPIVKEEPAHPYQWTWQQYNNEQIQGSKLVSMIYESADRGGNYVICVDNGKTKTTYLLDEMLTRTALTYAQDKTNDKYIKPNDIYICSLKTDSAGNKVTVDLVKNK